MRSAGADPEARPGVPAVPVPELAAAAPAAASGLCEPTGKGKGRPGTRLRPGVPIAEATPEAPTPAPALIVVVAAAAAASLEGGSTAGGCIAMMPAPAAVPLPVPKRGLSRAELGLPIPTLKPSGCSSMRTAAPRALPKASELAEVGLLPPPGPALGRALLWPDPGRKLRPLTETASPAHGPASSPGAPSPSPSPSSMMPLSSPSRAPREARPERPDRGRPECGPPPPPLDLRCDPGAREMN